MKIIRFLSVVFLSINIYSIIIYLLIYFGLWDEYVLKTTGKMPVYFSPILLIPINLVFCIAFYFIHKLHTQYSIKINRLFIINIFASLSIVVYVILSLLFMDTL